MTKEMTMLAKEFALKAHGNQKYGKSPYGYHLHKVVNVLKRFGHESNLLLASAWLHDVVEDTYVNISEIEQIFGTEIASVVDLVTNVSGIPKKKSKVLTYSRIATNPTAMTVKLADRIANVEEGILNAKTGKVSKYRKEHTLFSSLLGNTHEPEMWSYLNGLLLK